MAGSQRENDHIGQLSSFFQAIRAHRWDDSLCATAMFFTEDHPQRPERLPRALAEQVMAQVEHPGNLDRWDNPAYRLVTLILIGCGLRVSDALRLKPDCVVADPEGAPYLRYFNHKMKREALVPIDEQLQALIAAQQNQASTSFLFPRPTKNVDGHAATSSSTYRLALYRWLQHCDVRDEHGLTVHLTPAPMASHPGHPSDQPGRPPRSRAAHPGPRLATDDRALREPSGIAFDGLLAAIS